MMKIELIVTGKPISKKRPRFSKIGNFMKTYDIQSKEKKEIASQMMKEISRQGILKRLSGPLAVNMSFHMLTPVSWPKKKRQEVLGIPHDKRPDIDNLAKMYLDVMNELIYDDDSQITTLWCEKTYSDIPCVIIEIMEIG